MPQFVIWQIANTYHVTAYHLSNQRGSKRVHSGQASSHPLGTSENSGNSLCFCMLPHGVDLTVSMKILLFLRNPYKTLLKCRSLQ